MRAAGVPAWPPGMGVDEPGGPPVDTPRRLWVDADWDDLGPVLSIVDEFSRAVRPRDGIELTIAAGDLSDQEALRRLTSRLREIPGLPARDGHLPEMGVHGGRPPAEEPVLSVRDPAGLAHAVSELRAMRRSLAVAAAVTPVMDRAEWMAGWRPEPGFHPLVVDNASHDATAELAAAAGADVVVQPEPIGRVANWLSAAHHFRARTSCDWLKWHFAGDELLPGAADLIEDAAAAHPEARMIAAAFQLRLPDGTTSLWQDLEHTALLSPEEALALSARRGNWFGPPSAHAIHRDAIDDLEFGTQPYVADWQACLTVASRHPVLYLAEPIAIFDTTQRKFFSAHRQEVHSLVQELSMRGQSLARLRVRAPTWLGLEALGRTVDLHAATALSERVRTTHPLVRVLGERTPEPPVAGPDPQDGPAIAVHAPRDFDPSGRDFEGWIPEFISGYARYAYVPELDDHPELRVRVARGEHAIGPHGLEILTNPAQLNERAEILVCLAGRPYLPELAPPATFDGLKAYHAWEFAFHAEEANRALTAGGVDLLLGYCRHDEHSPFFRAMYPTFAGRTVAVPFGFAPRFRETTPFHERNPRAVGIGSVNPVDDPACPPGELDAYVAFHPGVRWTHAWRRMLSEHSVALADVLEARFPEFPQTKDAAYDAVAALNEFMMFANDPGLLAFPPARTYEGPACGTVLVGEDSAVHHDLGFRHGENALLHRPGDLEDFARVVREGQSDLDRLTAIADSGRTLVAERYSHPRVARTLYEHLCRVYAGRQP